MIKVIVIFWEISAHVTDKVVTGDHAPVMIFYNYHTMGSDSSISHTYKCNDMSSSYHNSRNNHVLSNIKHDKIQQQYVSPKVLRLFNRE